jgi:dihydrofolate reductase
MSRVVVQEFISLDGVVQAPGGPDEDPSGGFAHGGWATDFDEKHDDGAGGQLIWDWESRTEALLLGRKTYDIWSKAWGVWDENAPGLEGELTKRYNRVPKFIASRSSLELEWKNSHLIGDDLPAAVARMKDEVSEGEIRVWGSSVLIRSLAEHDLIDEYRLMQYPLVLGSGKKLFPDGFALSRLALKESRALASGVVVNVYTT